MSEFKITKTSFRDLFILETFPFKDERGTFSKLFCHSSMQDVIQKRQIKQINYSYTRKIGTVRGFHFQYPPFSEFKLVTCLKGKIFDVVIDLRKGSPTFLKNHSMILDEGDNLALCIPEGFAHGFQSLSKNSEILYFHTEKYMPKAEGNIYPLDSKVAVEWPLECTEISDKDLKAPCLDISNFKGLETS